MNLFYKRLFFGLIFLGFIFGLMQYLIPNQTALVTLKYHNYFQIQRLHIFLFNLVAGGTLLLWYSTGEKKFNSMVKMYLVVSFIFSIVIYFNQYIIGIFLSVVLAVIVENVRIKKFSFIPLDFFTKKLNISQKFHQAALLCLSMALIISALVMLNNNVFKRFDLLNLVLDDFFLGFSFPLSLITFSLMFKYININEVVKLMKLQEISFWTVTLGVIIFFVFIIYGYFPGEIVLATILLIAVLLFFYIFKINYKPIEEEKFLKSGIYFLILTSIIGVSIVLLNQYSHNEEINNIFYNYHSYLALYGWNLSGMILLIRKDEFPIKTYNNFIFISHWILILIMIPIALKFPIVSIPTSLFFGFFLYYIFFSKSKTNTLN